MKKIISLCGVVCLLVLQLSVFAQDNDKKTKYAYSREKSYSKSYSIASSDKISIKNSFGSVKINTWTKSEVKVDVKITVSAETEDWANSVLGDINVEDNKSGGIVSFKTLHAGDMDKKDKGNRQEKYNGKNSKQSMEVHYEVYLPASSPLKVANDFGAINIPDYKGEVELISKFGTLTTGDLTNVKNLQVEFGKAKFGVLHDADLVIKFSGVEFEKLTGKNKVRLEFCNASRINIDNSLTSLDVDASYSTVNLRPVGSVGATYAVATSFGTFKNKTDIKFESDEDGEGRSGPKFDHKYWSKEGSGAIKVNAKTNFGKIILGEATAEEMKDKEKSKKKAKEV